VIFFLSYKKRTKYFRTKVTRNNMCLCFFVGEIFLVWLYKKGEFQLKLKSQIKKTEETFYLYVLIN